jgi:hypothetical protein
MDYLFPKFIEPLGPTCDVLYPREGWAAMVEVGAKAFEKVGWA